MLRITIPGRELYDESTNRILETKETVLTLEHSLVSISKWESKYCIPFLTDTPMTDEQTLYYIKCMTLTQNVDDEVYKCLTNENVMEIENYIHAPMTATTIQEPTTPEIKGTIICFPK